MVLAEQARKERRLSITTRSAVRDSLRFSATGSLGTGEFYRAHGLHRTRFACCSPDPVRSNWTQIFPEFRNFRRSADVRTAAMVPLSRGHCVALACLLAGTSVLPAQLLKIVKPGAADLSGSDKWYIRNLVYGRVVIGGGGAPPMPVAIALVCGDWIHSQGQTDARGRFRFRPQRHADVNAAIARAGKDPAGEAYSREILYQVSWPGDLVPCDVTAELAGYRAVSIEVGLLAQDGVTLVGDRSQEDVGFMILHRLEDFDGYARSSTTSLAPSAARKAYESGVRALERRVPNLEQAASRFERALEVFPEFAGAWSALGLTRWTLGDDGEALQAFTRAVNADPKYLMPYEVMMEMVLESQNWEELGRLTERYLEISPTAPMTLYMSVAAALNLDNLALAEERMGELEELGAKDYWAKSHAILAVKQENNSKFKEAAKAYEAFLSVYPDHSTADTLKRKIFEWKRLKVIDEPNPPDATKAAP